MSQLKQVRNESLADCLLSQAKAPVGGKLSVAGNQERIQDAPGIIQKKVILFILTSASFRRQDGVGCYNLEAVLE